MTDRTARTRRVVAPAPVSRRRHPFRAVRGDDGGMSAVEFGLVAPILITLLLGVMHYGSVALHRMQMANAVRAGLQYATIRKPVQEDLSQILSAVAASAPAQTTDSRTIAAAMFCECSDGTSVSCSGTCTTGERAAFLSIEMNEDYEPPIGFLGTNRIVTLQSQAAIRLN